MKLFISTSSDKIYLLAYDANGIKAELVHQGHNDHTKTLYGLIRSLNVNLDQVNDIYVTTGPGSFTGLRVGVIFAKLLCQKNDAKLYPVNMLELLSSMYHQPVAIDARGGNYYVLDDSNEVVITKELDGKYIIDPVIDLNQIINNSYLNTLTPVNYLDVKIVYVKHPVS